MRRAYPVVVGALLLVHSGCGKGGEQKNAATPEPRWKMASLEWKDEACSDPDACTHVAFVYPVFTGGAAVALNAYVSDRILRPPFDGGAGATPEEIAHRFLDEFHRFKSEFPESAQYWTLERSLDVLSAPAGVISVRCLETVFSGGAHGLETVALASFDAATGRRLGRPHLFRPGTDAEQGRIAEAAFRRARDLAPDDDLAAAGFTFDDGRFRTGDNFALTDGGLLFRFDPYEVAPYAWGPTDFLIPRADLAGIALAGGPLAPAGTR